MDLLKTLQDHAFFQEYWSRQPLVFRSSINGLGNQADMLAEVLAGKELVYPDLRAFDQSGPVSPLLYTASDGHHLSEKIAADKVMGLLGCPGTMKVLSLDRFHAGVQAIRERFAKIFPEAEISVNGYFSNGPCHGVMPHYDPYHIFAIQLDGAKEWSLGDVVVESPHKDFFHAQVGNPSFKQRLVTSSGDVLYIPPGTWHHVYTPESSTHLTIGIQMRRVYHQFQRILIDLASRYPDFRHDMPMEIIDDQVRYSAMSPRDVEAILSIIRFEALKNGS